MPKKWACFQSPKPIVRLTSFYQQSTTNSPSKNHILHPIFAKTPSKNEVSGSPKKNTAKAMGVRGLRYFIAVIFGYT